MDKSEYHTRDSVFIKKIDELYKKEKVWCGRDTNDSCKKCRGISEKEGLLYYGPTLPLYIGSKWHKANLKILFVGKVIEKSQASKKSCYIGSKNEAYDNIFNLEGENNKYFYDKKIYHIKENKNFEPEDYLAMTNMVKCGAGSARINVRFVEKHFASNCFDKENLNLFDKELKILNPDVVIFLTSGFYLNQLERRYFLSGSNYPSKYRKGDYWVSKINNTLFIASWHPGRKPNEFVSESRKLFAGQIKKFINEFK